MMFTPRERHPAENSTLKRLLMQSLGLMLLVTMTSCAASYGQTEVRASMRSPGSPVSVSYFYDNLSPYGEWFQNPSYGWCWTPYDVSAEWRPYSEGHWEYTDFGWSWASDEPWGWASYHYGRWFFDDSYGWAWVPGTEWAPAWVAWRYDDRWVGWAPLPPAAGWDVSGGLAFSEGNTIPSHEWCFVPREHVFDVTLRVQVTSVARNVTLFERSRDATRFEVREGRPANVGPDVAQIEASLGRRVPRVKIVDADTPVRGGGHSVGNGSVGFFRPMIRPGPADQAPAAEATDRRNPVPDAVLQRQREENQRKLESDLNSERTRLARDQENEVRAQAPGVAVDEVRKRHAAEQQAFEDHAARQRQVLAQRMQKQIVKPGKTKDAGKSGEGGKDKERGKDGH
jgi:hypothetical protein